MDNYACQFSRSARLVATLLYLAIGLLLILKIPDIVGYSFLGKYIYVVISYFVVTGIWLTYIYKYGFYIFEPSTIVLVITIITYSIEPLISIITDDTTIGGFEVFDGCYKATTIYMFATIIFMFFYYNTSYRRKQFVFFENFGWYRNINRKVHVQTLLILAYLFVLIGVGVSLIDLLMRGYDIEYIFSLGVSGEFSVGEESTGVFINLRYLMIPGFLYLDIYETRKWRTILLRAIVLACLLIRTTRWIVIVLLMSPIVLKYLRENRKVNYSRFVIYIVIFILIISGMQFTRSFVRDGLGAANASWNNFDLMYIWSAFSGNFDLYKTLYGAVSYFPDKHFYTLGQQMIVLTLVTCIPRSIWSNKPVSIIDSVLKPYFMGQESVRGHWAYAQLTEFYIEFGIIGVMICMAIFGRLCAGIRNMYVNNRDIHDYVLAAFLFPMLMQFVIRGYMPINFWALFFMLIPVWIMRLLNLGDKYEQQNY